VKTLISDHASPSGTAGVAAVERALALLDAFDSQLPELTLAELAQRTGLYKSTILRLADSLERFGYLQRLPNGKFRLGAKPFQLAALCMAGLHQAEIVMPALRNLTATTLESAALYVIAGDKRLCLYRCRSPRAITDNVQQGELLPLERGAGGHVLLAFSGRPGKRYEDVRRDVVAVTLGDRDSETAAVACPVFGAGDRLEGALSLSGPLSRFTPDAVSSFRTHLLDTGRKLTLLLGGNPGRLSSPAISN
jgi:DNA-binding IclR family transcriptional regulator